MLDLVLTVFGLACIMIGLLYWTFSILDWYWEQDHRRTLEDRKSLKEYLRQDKEDGDDRA